MIAEKSSDVKVKRVSRLTESKARCCISHDFGGFYQIIPCIRPAVVRIKVAHGCPATIRILQTEGARRATNSKGARWAAAVQTWQREPGGRPMPPAMEAKGARSTIRERGSRGQSLSPLRLSSKCVGGMGLEEVPGGQRPQSMSKPSRVKASSDRNPGKGRAVGARRAIAVSGRWPRNSGSRRIQCGAGCSRRSAHQGSRQDGLRTSEREELSRFCLRENRQAEDGVGKLTVKGSGLVRCGETNSTRCTAVRIR